jgi:hypothetical protein
MFNVFSIRAQFRDGSFMRGRDRSTVRGPVWLLGDGNGLFDGFVLMTKLRHNLVDIHEFNHAATYPTVP